MGWLRVVYWVLLLRSAARLLPGCKLPDTATRSQPIDLVAEWINLTLFGIILPTIKLQVYTFWGL